MPYFSALATDVVTAYRTGGVDAFGNVPERTACRAGCLYSPQIRAQRLLSGPCGQGRLGTCLPAHLGP